MKEFNEAEYKIGIQPSTAFIFTDNKQVEDITVVKPHLQDQQRKSNILKLHAKHI